MKNWNEFGNFQRAAVAVIIWGPQDSQNPKLRVIERPREDILKIIIHLSVMYYEFSLKTFIRTIGNLSIFRTIYQYNKI